MVWTWNNKKIILVNIAEKRDDKTVSDDISCRVQLLSIPPTPQYSSEYYLMMINMPEHHRLSKTI